MSALLSYPLSRVYTETIMFTSISRGRHTGSLLNLKESVLFHLVSPFAAQPLSGSLFSRELMKSFASLDTVPGYIGVLLSIRLQE